MRQDKNPTAWQLVVGLIVILLIAGLCLYFSQIWLWKPTA